MPINPHKPPYKMPPLHNPNKRPRGRPRKVPVLLSHLPAPETPTAENPDLTTGIGVPEETEVRPDKAPSDRRIRKARGVTEENDQKVTELLMQGYGLIALAFVPVDSWDAELIGTASPQMAQTACRLAHRNPPLYKLLLKWANNNDIGQFLTVHLAVGSGIAARHRLIAPSVPARFGIAVEPKPPRMVQHTPGALPFLRRPQFGPRPAPTMPNGAAPSGAPAQAPTGSYTQEQLDALAQAAIQTRLAATQPPQEPLPGGQPPNLTRDDKTVAQLQTEFLNNLPRREV